MANLTGRKRAFPLGMGDVKSDALQRLDEWTTGIVDVLKDLAAGNGLGLVLQVLLLRHPLTSLHGNHSFSFIFQ